MKARYLFLLLLIASAAFIAAQSRDDVRIYIPLVTADDPEFADFFRKNFTMEISAAGYTVIENVQEADYSLRMIVRSNSPEPDSPDEHKYTLQIILMRNSDTAQIVSLSFGFNELEEMYNHNLSLAYQTLANVPLGGSGDKTLVKYMVGSGEGEEDWWRNKWLYFRVSLDYPISYFQIKPDGLYNKGYLFEGDDVENPDRYSRISRQTVAMPGATVGVEAQFLPWMSLEANFELRLWDIAGFAFFPVVGAQVKFPLKPSSHFMLEPYVAASFPRYAVGAGGQLGVRGWNDGVFFFDAHFMYSLFEVLTLNADENFTQPEVLHWNRFTIVLSFGYKFGIINRSGSSEGNTTWLFKK